MSEILRMRPAIMETVWGGTGLSAWGLDLPSDHCGEAWVVSAHPRGESVVAEGRFAGMTLGEVYREHRDLFGPDAPEQFPLLVKIIDAKEDLSIQVHPDDAYAAAHENAPSGKTECWLVTEAGPGEEIVFGHTARTRDELDAMIAEGRFEDLVCRRPVTRGDFLWIEPGTVHAICGGTQIVEVQQNCDITYRLYDYGRLADGKPRTLHLEEAAEVIRVPFTYRAPESRETAEDGALKLTLAEQPVFSVMAVHVTKPWTWSPKAPWVCGLVLDGTGSLSGLPVKKGDSFLILSPDRMEITGTPDILFAGPGGSSL